MCPVFTAQYLVAHNFMSKSTLHCLSYQFFLLFSIYPILSKDGIEHFSQSGTMSPWLNSGFILFLTHRYLFISGYILRKQILTNKKAAKCTCFKFCTIEILLLGMCWLDNCAIKNITDDGLFSWFIIYLLGGDWCISIYLLTCSV